MVTCMPIMVVGSSAPPPTLATTGKTMTPHGGCMAVPAHAATTTRPRHLPLPQALLHSHHHLLCHHHRHHLNSLPLLPHHCHHSHRHPFYHPHRQSHRPPCLHHPCLHHRRRVHPPKPHRRPRYLLPRHPALHPVHRPRSCLHRCRHHCHLRRRRHVSRVPSGTTVSRAPPSRCPASRAPTQMPLTSPTRLAAWAAHLAPFASLPPPHRPIAVRAAMLQERATSCA